MKHILKQSFEGNNHSKLCTTSTLHLWNAAAGQNWQMATFGSAESHKSTTRRWGGGLCFMMSFLRGFMRLIFSCSWDLIGMSRNDLEWYQYHLRKCPAPKSVVIGGWVCWSCWAGRSLQCYQQSSLIWFDVCVFPSCLRVWLWSTGLTYVYIYIHTYIHTWWSLMYSIYLIMYTYIIHIFPPYISYELQAQVLMTTKIIGIL